MIRAKETERSKIEAFLKANCTKMMFPWSNLLRHGMSGGHPRAMSFWYAGKNDPTDVIGVTDEGAIMPYCPNGFDNLKSIFDGQTVMGLLGESDSVEQIRAALGLGHAELDQSEPHFDLNIKDMIVPDTKDFTLHRLEHAPLDLIREWRSAYSVESLSVPGEDAADKAAKDIANYIKNDSHRVLYDGDTPIAMTGFNATAPGVVQVGGVYTPPPLRSRGYARAALSMHLAEAHENGVTRATLFAANDAAVKAYQAIGFMRVGRFSIIVYERPQHV